MVKVNIEQTKEKWYKSRRVWCVALTFIAGGFSALGYDVAVPIITGIAGLLGLSSFVYPKK